MIRRLRSLVASHVMAALLGGVAFWLFGGLYLLEVVKREGPSRDSPGILQLEFLDYLKGRVTPTEGHTSTRPEDLTALEIAIIDELDLCTAAVDTLEARIERAGTQTRDAGQRLTDPMVPAILMSDPRYVELGQVVAQQIWIQRESQEIALRSLVIAHATPLHYLGYLFDRASARMRPILAYPGEVLIALRQDERVK